MSIKSVKNTSKERSRTLLTVETKLPKLVDFLYRVSSESLWLGSSKQGIISSAGRMEKWGLWVDMFSKEKFCFSGTNYRRL